MTVQAATDLIERIRWPEGSGVLRTGSTAEGVAMGGSNINVTVVGAPVGWTPESSGTALVRPMTIATNHLLASEPVLSIDVVDGAYLSNLRRLAAGMALVEDPGTPDLALPVLDVLEVRLLSRLRAGVVLHGATTVERWRRQLRLEWLPAFYAVMTYQAGVHFLRKARRARSEDLTLDVPVLLRMALEHLMLSALAADGRVLHEVKNLGRTVLASRSTWTDPPRILAEAHELLSCGIGDGQAFDARLGDLAADLLDRMATASSGEAAARYLRAQT